MSTAVEGISSTRPFGSFVDRRLDRYPASAMRYLQLGLAVLVTITLYYELYVQSSVATKITATYHMTFDYFVAVLVVGNALGAVASYVAGLTDRVGRANVVVYGLLVTGALVLFGMPNAGSKSMYLVMYALLSIVEGALLVATPALIRDYSPQLGRAVAMGFWTMGPVLGSLIVTEVSSNTLDTHPDWRYQFHVAGLVGLIVAAIAIVLMRELSPKLRDQLMVSLNDKAVIEARAAGIDPDALTKHHWRQMARGRIAGSALGISVFLLLYFILVAFFVVYAVTSLGYTEARANALANWYWISNAIALVVAGVASDKLRVRKPFMVVGTLISAPALAVLAARATDAHTSYYTFALLLAIIAAGGGVVYCAWMAAFTETVESINPAATATGLAVWGTIIRSVVTVAFLILPFVVTAASPLVDQGPRTQALASRYASQLAVLQKVDSATAATLAADPNDAAAQATAVSEVAGAGITAADVTRAVQLQEHYKAELATLQKVDPATLAQLFLNPSDRTAQISALSQISGLSAADVATVLTVQAQHPQEIQTLETVTVPHLLALQANQSDPAAIQAAVTDLVTKLHITPAAALQRLTALATVPPAQLTAVFTDGATVAGAASALQAAAKVPSADLLFLQSSGTKIQAAATSLTTATAAVPKADLAFLTANGAKVQKAHKDIPGQWQSWFWVCFAGQIAFLLSVGLVTGRWSPRRAAADVREHQARVAAELAALAAGGQAAEAVISMPAGTADLSATPPGLPAQRDTSASRRTQRARH